MEKQEINSIVEILKHLDFEHLRFLINNFYEGRQGEQTERRIATKVHILALCKALDREPTNKDFKGKLKENEPQEEKEDGYKSDADTDERDKEEIWSERAEDLREEIGIFQPRQMLEIKKHLLEEHYIEKTDRKHHQITQKGEDLLQLYAEALEFQAKKSQFYVIKNKKMAGALESIPKWRYDSGKADKEHVEEQLSEDENPGDKTWNTDPLKPLMNLDRALDSIETELKRKRKKIEINIEGMEESQQRLIEDISQNMENIEKGVTGISDEEKQEITLLLQGRY